MLGWMWMIKNHKGFHLWRLESQSEKTVAESGTSVLIHTGRSRNVFVLDYGFKNYHWPSSFKNKFYAGWECHWFICYTFLFILYYKTRLVKNKIWVPFQPRETKQHAACDSICVSCLYPMQSDFPNKARER